MSTHTSPTSGPVEPESNATTGSTHGDRNIFLIAVAAVVALIIGLAGGWLLFSPRYPGDDSAEAGFARDMTEHHHQAIEMSLIVLEATDSNDIRALATDILTNQGVQVGRMQGWLIEWGLPAASPTPERMAWMGDEHDQHADLPPGVPMPGMATPEEMQALDQAEGVEAEILYLQLMLTHHISGVEMAEAGLRLSSDPDVVQIATSMGMGQTMEIDLIVDLLADRDAEPRESPEELQALREVAEDAGLHEHN